MTTTTTPGTTSLPLLLTEIEAVKVDRLSPSFVRVEFGSPALADLGVDGPSYDQRFKLVFPHGDQGLPSVDGVDQAGMEAWYALPVEERGQMRTYTIRDIRGEGADTRLVVDFVVHGDGAHGPGGDWGAAAQVGDRLVTLAPRKGSVFGGIEFVPGTAAHLLLVGDETAVPAVAAILEQLPANAVGAAILEVPVSEDVQDLRRPEGVTVTWLPRDGAPRGIGVHEAALAHLGVEAAAPVVDDDEVDPDLWETPGFSSSGEDVDEPVRSVGHDLENLYAWIAGESAMVTGLRRALVKDLGVDRHQVCFMGYWREGVSMKG